MVKAPECCLGGHPHCSEVAHRWGMTESVRQPDARGTLAELVKESSPGGGRAWGLAESSDRGAVAGSEMPPRMVPVPHPRLQD